MGGNTYSQYDCVISYLYLRINDLGYYIWYQSGFNPKKIMFDRIRVMCFRTGKYVFFLTYYCMLNDG